MAQTQTTPGASLIGRFGLTGDPVGAVATFTIGERRYLVDVLRVRRSDLLGAWMLDTRHFNGEPGPTVALAVVELLNRHWTPEPPTVCPQCGGPLDFDPACVIDEPFYPPYPLRDQPLPRRTRTVAAVLCSRCEYCAEVPR